MLVGGTYRFRPTADQSVGLKRFQAWTPPAAFAFQGHWATADAMGGMFVAEAESAAAVLEATAAFGDLIEFNIVPIVEIMESVGITARVLAWVDSVA